MTTMVPFIPLILFTDILIRMSVKSLLRFRSVCREWCDLIDSTYFVNMHLHKNKLRRLIVKGKSNGFFASIDLKSLANTRELDLRMCKELLCSITYPFKDGRIYSFKGSCNGLICLTTTWKETILWNPSTKKYLFLPTLSMDDDLRVNSYAVKYNSSTAIGFDSTNGTYKVVRTVQQYEMDTVLDTVVKVFSVGSNSWRRVYGFPKGYDFSQQLSQVLVNEYLHWLVEGTEGSMWVVAFDLHSEKFNKFLISIEGLISLDGIINIHAIEECLSAGVFHMDMSFGLWMMKKYGEEDSWTKLISIREPYKFINEILAPILYTKDVGILLVECLLGSPTKYVWYDFATKGLEQVSILGLPEYFRAVILFTESLVPLNGGINY